jgi:hypothetical protein
MHIFINRAYGRKSNKTSSHIYGANKMFKRMLVGISLLCVASVANAGFVTQNFTITEKKTDFVETLSFNLFDDNGGTRELISVQFSLMAQTNGVARAENRGDNVTTVTAILNTEISLVDAMSNVVASSAPSLERTATLGAWDGTLDYAGLSGIDFENFNTTVSTSGSINAPTDLSAFIGMGSGSIIFTAHALSIVDGGGNLTTEVGTRASGSAIITFEYEDSLETSEAVAPSHLAFLGLGLVALFRLRKFKG